MLHDFPNRPQRRLRIAWAVLFCGVASCAAPDPRAGYVDPRPLGRELPATRPAADERPIVELAPPAAAGEITLPQAWSLALLHSPTLAGYSWDVRAAEARRVQGSLIPNPELSFGVENVGLALPAWEQSESTIGLSQLIELGGKRGARMSVAAAERDLAGWDYEQARLDLLTNVAKAFASLLGAQRKHATVVETVRVAEETLSAVSERVRAGAASPVEGTRAESEVAQARIDLRRAEAEQETARRRLAALWNETDPGFTAALGELEIDIAAPPLEDLVRQAERNPDLARWPAEIELRRREHELEKAQAVPDVTLEAGYRRIEDIGASEEETMTFGASVPLPIFNRNQGNVRAAEARLSRAKVDRRSAEVRLRTELAAAHAALSAAAFETATLKAEVIPRARATFQAVEEGYRGGKFGQLDLLVAQRAFADDQQRYADALVALHQTKAEVERLIAAPLESAVRPADSPEPKQEEPR